MYALAICGSTHKHGNMDILLETTLAPLKEKGWETEIYSLARKNLHGCLGCGECLKKKNLRCIITKDGLNDEILPRMYRADAILLGAPLISQALIPMQRLSLTVAVLWLLQMRNVCRQNWRCGCRCQMRWPGACL